MHVHHRVMDRQISMCWQSSTYCSLPGICLTFRAEHPQIAIIVLLHTRTTISTYAEGHVNQQCLDRRVELAAANFWLSAAWCQR